MEGKAVRAGKTRAETRGFPRGQGWGMIRTDLRVWARTTASRRAGGAAPAPSATGANAGTVTSTRDDGAIDRVRVNVLTPAVWGKPGRLLRARSDGLWASANQGDSRSMRFSRYAPDTPLYLPALHTPR
jgi:hypothetical protein